MKHLIGYMCDLMPVVLGHGGCDHPISSFQNSPMHIGHSYTQPNPKPPRPYTDTAPALGSSVLDIFGWAAEEKGAT